MFSQQSYLLKSLVFAALILSCSFVMADVRLPSVIGDNMVLQQQTAAPIWGWADPGEKITVEGNWTRAGKKKAVADQNGQWQVNIRTPKAGGPYTLTIAGDNTIELTNVLVGEVWVCSGQSNMEWSVSRANNPEKEIAAATYPNIRLFHVAKKVAEVPQEDCNADWKECSSETIPGFSAVAYFFGRELHSELDVPIGLIETCWGGTPAEAWTRKEALEANEDAHPILERHEKMLQEYPKAMEDYQQQVEDWKKKAEQAKAEGKKEPRKPRKPRGPDHPHSPSGLYNGMIAPLIPYAIQGAIWYQGESNASRAYQYRTLFPAMITNWRDDWDQGAFPFYYVQIAPYKYGQEDVCAELREAQMMTLSLKNTGMAVTMDIGNPKDIHPKNKQDVGKRLALWALAKDYGKKDIVYSGPIYDSMKIEGNKIRLKFDHVDGGLKAGPDGLANFTIAGADQNFVPAQAKIDGNTLLVFSPEVSEPVAVRYCWDNTSEGTLFNKAGLPASSFRTDDLPGVTADAK